MNLIVDIGLHVLILRQPTNLLIFFDFNIFSGILGSVYIPSFYFSLSLYLQLADGLYFEAKQFYALRWKMHVM